MSPPVQRLFAFLNRLPVGERAVPLGRDRLYADTLDRWAAAQGWRFGFLAGRERALIARTVRPGMTAVDVGANIGFHTLTLARAVGFSGRVHAIEPDPRNFRLLARAVHEAGCTHVQLHRAAASDHAGTVTLYLAAANRGDHRLYAADEPRDSVTVATIVLDAVLATESRVDFIKMDVQGAEVAVLRGLGATLESHPDVRILSELSPEMLERAGVDAEDFFAPLRARGRRLHVLGRDGTPEPIGEAAAWRAARAAGYIAVYCART
jgi:FkbM family methyltransferase